MALKLTYSNDLNDLFAAVRNHRHIFKVEIDSYHTYPDFLCEKTFFEALDSCDNIIFVDVNINDDRQLHKKTIKSELANLDKPLIFQLGSVDNKNVFFREFKAEDIVDVALNGPKGDFNEQIFQSKLSDGDSFGLKFVIQALQLSLIGSFNGPHHTLADVNIEFEKTFGDLTLLQHVIKSGDLLTLKFLFLNLEQEELELPLCFAAMYGNGEKMTTILTMNMHEHQLPKNYKNILLKAAVEAGNFETAKLMVERGAKPSESVVDLAYDTGRYKIVLMLLRADSVFPISFNLEEIDEYDESFDELKSFVDTRDELHCLIQKGDLARVEQLLPSMGRSKTYLNKDGHSAVWTALNFDRIPIFVWLKSEVQAELRDDNETSGLPLGVLESAKEALTATCAPLDDAHILYLVSKSKSALPKPNFKEIIESYYKKLDKILQVSVVLKVVQYGNQLDIIYDMNTDSIKNTSLTHSSVKGECDYIAGRIYIGGKREESELLGTIAHELTHLAMQILFDNDTKPYERNDRQQFNKYNAVLEAVTKNRFSADEIINKVFHAYREKSRSSELIVTVNHMLGKYGHEDGTRLLSNQAPKLLEFYDKEIVPRCEEFIRNGHQLNLKNSIKLLNDYSGVLNFFRETNICLTRDPPARTYSTAQINCVFTDYVLLSAIKLFSSLPGHTENFLIFNYDKYLTRREMIHTILGYNVCQVLILLCESKLGAVQFHKSARALSTILTEKYSKQVIFIMNNEVHLENDFSVSFDDPFSSNELSADSIKVLLEQTVCFQDNPLKLGRLIDEDTFELIDARTLTKLINKEEVLIGSRILTDTRYEEVKDYYIERKLIHLIKIQNHFKEDVSKFRVVYSGKVVTVDVQGDQDLVSISDDDKDFQLLCESHRGRNVHWLKKEGDELIWKKSQGTLAKLCEYASDDASAIDPGSVTDKIVIVVAEAGMGKSTVLSNLALKTKMAATDVWVARISLINCSKELNRLNDVDVPFDEVEVVKFLYRVVGFQLFKEKKDETGHEKQTRKQMIEDIVCSVNVEDGKIDVKSCPLVNKFEIELFNHLYNRGKVVLLLDGYDEINPDYKVQVLELLNVLKDTKVEKLWVTTRPYDIQSELEAVLGTFSYRLKPFDEQDQKLFLKRFWEQKFQGEKFDDERTNTFIDELLESFSVSIKDHESRFVSVPLQIQMIAEVFQGKFQEFHSRKEHEQLRREQFNLVSLFETFFHIKYYKIQYGDKAPEINADDAKIKILLRKEFQEVSQNHQELAIRALYNTTERKMFLSEDERERVFMLMENIKQSTEKTGIIDRVVDDTPIFVHQTFAEYFAALWLVENRHKKAVSDFLRENIFTNAREIIHNFFNLMLTDDEQCQVHVAVINCDIKIIEDLLIDKKLDINAVDKAGRTALHLAVAYDYQNIIEVLLEHSADVNITDTMFGWRPITYTDGRRHWDTAELLLQNGADGDDMFETVKNVNTYFASEGKSTLQIAAINGLVMFATFLMRRGANVQVQDKYGVTPLHCSIKIGSLEMVKCFVKSKKVDLNIRNKHGVTPLHLAAKKGHLEIVKYLVEKKVNVKIKDKQGNTAVHCAAEKGYLEIVQYLSVNKSVLNIQNQYAETPLHFAAKHGHLEIVKLCIETTSKLSAFNECYKTALRLAAKKGHLEILKYVYETTGNLNTTDIYWDTPLHFAARKGHLHIVEFIAKTNAVLNIQNLFGDTPLHLAAQKGHLNVVKCLIENNAELNIKRISGDTPLHYAAKTGHYKIINLLEKDDTPLHFYLIRDYLEIVKCLVESNAQVNIQNIHGSTPLHLAVECGNCGIVTFLVENGAGINIKNSIDETPLHIAAKEGHLRITQYFLSRDVELNTKNKFNKTPLNVAATGGYFRVVKYLVENNADCNIRNDCGDTLLHSTADAGNLELAKCLVEQQNFEIDSKNLRCETALHMATKEGHLEMVKFLVQNNADIHIVTIYHKTPLHLAAEQGHLEILEYLIDNKADCDMKNEYDETLLHFAADTGNVKLTQCLIKKNATVDANNIHGETPLHLAAQKGHLHIVKCLVENDANFNAKTNFTKTPVHYAVDKGHLDVIKYLVKLNADLSITDNYGQTPLHISAERGDLEVVECLANGDVNAIDNDGWTPLHYGILNGEIDIVRYLVDEKGVDVNSKAHSYGDLNRKHGDFWGFKEFVISKKRSAVVADTCGNGVSCLHIAALSDCLDVLKYLVEEKRVSVSERDMYERTPLYLAKRFKKKNSVRFLEIHDGCTIL